MKFLKGMMIAVISCLLFTGAAFAGVAVDFLINGDPAGNADSMTVDLGTKLHLTYPINAATFFDDVDWFVKYDNGMDNGQWEHYDGNRVADLKVFITGDHQIRLKVKRLLGFNWWGPVYDYGDRIFTFRHTAGNASAATEYPVLLIPGVLGFDDVELLGDAINIEYFLFIADSIRAENANQIVKDISLHPWMETEARGEDLKNKIIDFLKENDPCFEYGKMKVNLVAHSHGSTTARVAIRKLVEHFDELYARGEVKSNGSRVASLTTVAGPHYGTPSADGGFQYVEMRNAQVPGSGDELWNRADRFFKLLGLYISHFSGHREYLNPSGQDVPWWEWTSFLNSTPFDGPNNSDCEGCIISTQNFDAVAHDFTQREMYEFNKKYPSVGLPPGGKYILNASDVAWLENQGVFVDTNDLVDENDVSPGENKYNYAYGHGADRDANVQYFDVGGEMKPFVVGDGMGNMVYDLNDPKAVQYYSFTGNGSFRSATVPVVPGIGVDLDVYDMGLLIFNSFHIAAGEEFESLPDHYQTMKLDGLDEANDLLEELFRGGLSVDQFDDAIRVVHNFMLRDMNRLAWCVEGPGALGEIGYIRETDSFIPVDSSHFGIFTGLYNWNHGDEHNQLLEMKAPKARDPKEVYVEHVQMLKDRGL